MPTESSSSTLLAWLYAVGLALLLAAFFLLVPAAYLTQVAWLDLAVAGIVYSINFSVLFGRRISIGSFSRRIPALGLLGLTDLLYSCLAMGLIWRGVLYTLPFRIQLVGQMGLLFVAAVAAAIAWNASEHADSVAGEESEARSGVQKLKAALARCEAEVTVHPSVPQRVRQHIFQLKEDAGYLSPCRDASALSYEQQLAAQVDEVRLQLAGETIPLPLADIDAQLERCSALMALRKQILNR
jgi:hypothetical protein